MNRLYVCVCFAVAFPMNFFSSGVVFIAPLSVVVAPNRIAVFNCSADYSQQPVIKVYINNTIYGSYFANRIQVQGLKISVNATPDINNTQLYCSDPYQGQISPTAVLFVASPPCAPSPRVKLANNTAIEAFWDAPFTHPGFQILSYAVTILNTSSGISTVVSPLMNASFLFNTNGSRISESCYDISFCVVASSEIGRSLNGCVSATLPVAPRNFASEPSVIFGNNSTAGVQAEVTVQFPVGLCPSQSVNYSISVMDAGSGVNVFAYCISLDKFADIGPVKSVVTCTTFEPVCTYVVIAKLESLTGSVTTRITFNATKLQLPIKATVTPLKLPDNDVVTVTAAASGAAIFVLLVVVMVLSIVLAYFRRSSERLKNSSARYQAHNPIYSGPVSVYETVSEASFQTRASDRLSTLTDADEKDSNSLCYALKTCPSESTLRQSPQEWAVKCTTAQVQSDS